MTRALLLLLCLLAAMPAQARLSGLGGNLPHAAHQRDLAEIRKSGELRVLVNQSRNSSGEIRGEAIGVEYQRLRAFDQYLNRNARDGHELRLKIIPKPKNELIAALQKGEGDLVAPGELLDAHPGLGVSASAAIRSNVALVVVGNRKNRHYKRLEEMSGRTLTLPVGSAVSDALREVNQKLSQRGKPPILVEWADPSLAVEDVLEMVQAGIYPWTAVELPIAERWQKVMPRLRIERHLVVGNEGNMSWFVRRESPMLRARIDRFLAEYRTPGDQDSAFQRFYRRSYKVRNPMSSADRQRLEKVRSVLQKHGEKQEMDWLHLAAVAYKESTLNPSARGASGATGLMQITPAAARSVGVGSIQNLENNVQAATLYMARLRREFFSSRQIAEEERMAFVLAAYNLGPQRVQSLRAEARRRGLNPNRWFFQVERVAMEQLGMGVVSYVNSVNKYYLAYDRERLSLEPRKQKLSAKK
ncbi:MULTISPECIES: transglycosylase SLT domain-containing protein [unclassified Pseudomonas]|uniref:transglycosylase SLT domain-containing protein n=1 Tax=unclassified Pseudomonas TaxID=196821 RepID=UPI002447C7C3|nr:MULTISPECIES: transglycosylase SLT domain-containing protein [unclassified Pseudomonas]MDH0894036.1 transglycosylase SLT domain-containing protein [Pseudomonas sp. GD03875]MDH1062791.1 transglycosylase SLT domain-containing protein [Pseudomonas sp. GD03985]